MNIFGLVLRILFDYFFEQEVCKCVSGSSESACTFEILHSGLVPQMLRYDHY